MSKHPDPIHVVGVDQVFPLLTTDPIASPGGSISPGGDQGPVVTAALRDVLGWRPREQDSKAFLAALDASFRLSEFEGHRTATYVAQGFAMQADLGFVSGGQASLYQRARSAYEQMTSIFDGLKPLRPDVDQEDFSALMTELRVLTSRLPDELGNPGGPRMALVDSNFEVLLGPVPQPSAGGGAPARLTADDVPGALGNLREIAGFTDEFCSTVPDERMRTMFWTLVDLALDVRRSWEDQKFTMASGAGSGFLGTDLVVISRGLAAASEQVDELLAVLGSVGVSSAAAQALELDKATGLTLDGLVSWLSDFLTNVATTYIKDTGRDGISTGLTPQLNAILDAYRQGFVDVLHPPTGGSRRGLTKALTLVPLRRRANLPAGFYSARVRVAVTTLYRSLCDLYDRSARLGRFPGRIVLDVRFEALKSKNRGKGQQLTVQVSARVLGVRPDDVPVLVGLNASSGKKKDLRMPLQGSVSVDADTLTANFRFRDSDQTYGKGSVLAPLWTGGVNAVVVPGQAVPIKLMDGLSQRVVLAPPTKTWPPLQASGGLGRKPTKTLTAKVGLNGVPPMPAPIP